MTYFIILIILICFEYFTISFCTLDNEKRDNIFLLLSFIQCVLFLGLRSDIIPDSEKYFYIYEMIGRQRLDMIFNVFNFEKGYVIFNKIIYTIFGDNRVIFFSSCAILCCLPVFLLIKKFDTNKLLPILIWCIFNGLNTALINIRQSIAIGIILLAYYIIVRKKLILSFTLVLIAANFHKSAIFLLIIFPLYFVSEKIELSIRNILLFIPIFTIIFIFSDQIFNFLLENTIDSYYSYTNYHLHNTLGAYLYIFITFVIFLFSWLIYTKNFRKFSSIKFMEWSFFLYLLLTGFLFYLISIKNGLNRMALYFVSIYIYIIPQCFKTISANKNIKAIMLIILFICFGMVISGMYFLPSSFAIGKYQTIFD
ncbi:EpsG family protein [Candidatus Ruminimicrobium bovinum]|uniref:EpsG family protein n=1 Tax=Candidatus Ruminimicrobium bovinum TaxID=3242779 RepID=UPI0039B882FE